MAGTPLSQTTERIVALLGADPLTGTLPRNSGWRRVWSDTSGHLQGHVFNAGPKALVVEDGPLLYVAGWGWEEEPLRAQFQAIDQAPSDLFQTPSYLLRFLRGQGREWLGALAQPRLPDGGFGQVVHAIEAGVDPNMTHKHHSLLTLLAAGGSEEHLRLMRFLVDKGADSNAKAHSKSTTHSPLAMAVIMDRHDAVRVLLELGAQVDMLDSKLQTALHHAARQRDMRSIHLLLDAGANPNRCARDRKSPRMLAEDLWPQIEAERAAATIARNTVPSQGTKAARRM